MPYKVGGSNLPSNVKKMDDKKQRQWVAVWNSEYDKHGDEGRAFAAANGVAGKKDYYDQLYEASARKVLQEVAQYDAMGMHDGMGCANCHLFLSPDSCVLVSGAIAPTGLSKFYMKSQVYDTGYGASMEPDDDEDDDAYTMPLMGKSADRNIVGAVLSGVKAMLRPNISVKESQPLTFLAVKDVSGDTRLRFMAVVSNNFKDREAEIIPEAAHREYVDWATKENTYPELWLWHAGPASRWGQADWLDVNDGFLVASGLVDKGYEYIAHNLQQEAKEGNPSGVSHGFMCVKNGSTIGPYRTFELSPLPMTAAANEWTGFNTIAGENMAFTQEKREWLKKTGGISDEAISTLEQTTSSVAKSLRERGIEYKDLGSDALAVLDPPKTATVTPPAQVAVRSPLDAAIMSITGIKAATAAAGATKDAGSADTSNAADLAAAPHMGTVAHMHNHMDGTVHEHPHHHADGSMTHDTVAHENSGASDADADDAKKEVTNANKAKPAEYASVPDEKFLDTKNFKYPIDPAHIKAAHSFFNQKGQREKGGYTTSEWSAMGGKLAKALGNGFEYKDEQVIETNKALVGDTLSSKEFVALDTKIATIGAAVEANSAQVKELAQMFRDAIVKLSKDDDAKTADFFKSKVVPATVGYQASEAQKNTNTPLAEQFDKERKAVEANGWFNDTIMKGLEIRS